MKYVRAMAFGLLLFYKANGYRLERFEAESTCTDNVVAGHQPALRAKPMDRALKGLRQN